MILLLFFRSQVTKLRKPNGKEIQSICWFPNQTATLYQIPSFQSIVVLNVPNTHPNTKDEVGYSRLQHVSFWRIESKSFSKYGNLKEIILFYF